MARDDFAGYDDGLFGVQQRAEERKLAVDRAEMFAKQDEILRSKARERISAENRETIIADYRARGLEPPPGYLVSLPTLLSIGWRVEEMEQGKRVLVKPPALEPYVPRDRDSLPETTKGSAKR